MLEIIEIGVTVAIALATLGEGYSHLLPNRLLPKWLQPQERKTIIGRRSTWLLLVALFIDVPVVIVKNASSKQEIERLNSRVHKIDNDLGGRHLSEKQRSILREKVLPGLVVYVTPYLPGESQDYANEIGATLREINQTTVSVSAGKYEINSSEGLLISVDHHNLAAQSLFDALQAAAVPLTDVSRQTVTVKNFVFIWVARKPSALTDRDH